VVDVLFQPGQGAHVCTCRNSVLYGLILQSEGPAGHVRLFASDGIPFCADGTRNGTPFCPGWDTILSRWDTKWDTILHRWDIISSRWDTKWDTNPPKWDTKGHQRTQKWCPIRLWSTSGPVEGSPHGFRALRGRKTGSGSQEWNPASFAISAGCGILLPAGFQPSKGGDMVCARGPLGAFVVTCHKVGAREGLL
jgi:hypothetical protein